MLRKSNKSPDFWVRLHQTTKVLYCLGEPESLKHSTITGRGQPPFENPAGWSVHSHSPRHVA